MDFLANIDVGNMTALLGIAGALIVVTNIITQVLKNAAKKFPTNILATVIGILVTVAAIIAYCQISAIAVTWYIVVGAVIFGFMVAFGAMFGYDKLKETLSQINRENKNSDK